VVGLKGSSIQLFEHDRIIVVPIYKHCIPSAEEVNLLFDLCKDNMKVSLGLAFLCISMMRPTEICRLRWHWFKIDDEVREFTHYIYKPQNRKTMLGRNFYFKETKKPIYSKWLSDLIISYAKICERYENNKLFPWTSADVLQKWFMVQRKLMKTGKLDDRYKFLLDTNTKTVHGAVVDRYRVSPYSLRRFAISFHYWVTYGGDEVKLAEVTGHSRVKTLLGHYVKPKESFGLTQKMIDDKIKIDQFIRLKGKAQMVIPDFAPDWDKKFTPVGQTSLHDFG